MEQGQAVIDLDKLEALAKAATPGPYSRISQSRRVTDGTGMTLIYTTASPEQSAYLAALDPATVLALIARARRAESLLLRCRERLDAHKDSDDLWEEINSCLTTPT